MHAVVDMEVGSKSDVSCSKFVFWTQSNKVELECGTSKLDPTVRSCDYVKCVNSLTVGNPDSIKE